MGPATPVGPSYPDKSEKVTLADVKTASSELPTNNPIDCCDGSRKMADDAMYTDPVEFTVVVSPWIFVAPSPPENPA